MDAASFARNFPATKVIPRELWELFRYQEDISQEYTGHFRLRDDLWDLPFQDSLSPYFVCFACDADGSFYAFWLYKDFPLELAPVVFLGFEGTSYTILANSLVEFLSLLSLGIDELGYSVQEDPNWHGRTGTGFAVTQFREWLQMRLGVSTPEDPRELVETARRSHPDLGTWLSERRKGNESSA